MAVLNLKTVDSNLLEKPRTQSIKYKALSPSRHVFSIVLPCSVTVIYKISVINFRTSIFFTQFAINLFKQSKVDSNFAGVRMNNSRDKIIKSNPINKIFLLSPLFLVVACGGSGLGRDHSAILPTSKIIESPSVLVKGISLDSKLSNITSFTQPLFGLSTLNNSAIDITDKVFSRRSANCADYVADYKSSVKDVQNDKAFNGFVTIKLDGEKCQISSNAIPHHDFNNGAVKFRNDVSEQKARYFVTMSPAFAEQTTPLSLRVDNAILLNGVKVDVLAAGCFNVRNGKVGCNDMNQPWRYDPLHKDNGFVVDNHNAHTQPDGTYHYHGTPNAFYVTNASDSESPVIGFAADGFPIFGPKIKKDGVLVEVLSSFRLKKGERPSGQGNPGGIYDGRFRDDYEYIPNAGHLDECNGMMHNGAYGYYITKGFPYIINCFKGNPDNSFKK